VQQLPEEDLKWFKAHAKSVDELEDLKVQCTACWEQVNHKVEVGKQKQSFFPFLVKSLNLSLVS
jgi:hypothetical protein